MKIVISEREKKKKGGKKKWKKRESKEREGGRKEGRKKKKEKEEKAPTTSRPLITKFQNIRNKRKFWERQTRFLHYIHLYKNG